MAQCCHGFQGSQHSLLYAGLVFQLWICWEPPLLLLWCGRRWQRRVCAVRRKGHEVGHQGCLL